ncbi:MAG: hypothetical protein JW764_09450 [Chlorobiaceae bacterium]|nr:hypothetical protein [Chlorobiaceae bacterium]
MLKENTPKEALPFGKPNKPIDLFGFIRRSGLLILVTGSFLFALSVPFVLLLSKPNYEVRALMRIDPVIPSVITTTEDPSIISYYSDYANTQAKRLLGFDVLKKAVEKLTPEQKASIFPADLPPDTCAEILQHLVKVNPVWDTHLLEITISGPKKTGLAPLVNNIMTVYLEKLRTSSQMQDNERLVFLRNNKEALSNEIAIITEKLDILTKDIATADFAETYNMASKKADELQQITINAFFERVSAQNQFRETEENNRQLGKLSLEPMVEEMVMGDQSLDFTSSWTYQQQQELRSTTDGLTASNPDRIYVEQRMKAMSDYEKKLRNEVRSTAKKIVYGKRDYEQSRELAIARNKAEKAQKNEEELLEELAKAKDESVRISLGLHLGEALKATLKHKRDLLDQIDTRMHELELEGKAPLHIAIESQAREPDAPAGSNTKKLLLIFFGVSFGLVGVVFIGFEYFDNRIRRPDEVKQALGYPPAKVVPKAEKEPPFHHIVNLEPEAPAARIIQSLAVRLVHEKESRNAKVILFSGVERQAGTSSLCLISARALASLVPKVLLIEAANNAPPLSGLTGHDTAPEGLVELLRSGKPPEEAIVKATAAAMPDILYRGVAPYRDLPQQGIAALIGQLSQNYDLILIDAPPVLESSLTEHFALHSDIVALITLGDSTMYRDLRSAAELLVRLEVPAIMPILNWTNTVKASAIDRLLENQPAFLEKIRTGKLEELLQQLPSRKQLHDVARNVTSRFKSRR